MNKNNNLSQLDKDQIIKRQYQEDMDAQRVMLVGGESIQINVDTSNIESALKNAVSNIEFKMPEMKKEVQEKNIFIPQLQIVEKPVIVKELEIREIQVPVIIKEIEIREIEKPIIVTEYKTVEVPVIVKETIIKEVEKPVVVTEYKTVEVPVIIKEVMVKEVEKPIIVTEYRTIEVPVMTPGKRSTFDKFLLISQVLLALGLVIKLIIK